jgi:hypothetical protein
MPLQMRSSDIRSFGFHSDFGLFGLRISGPGFGFQAPGLPAHSMRAKPSLIRRMPIKPAMADQGTGRNRLGSRFIWEENNKSRGAGFC